MMPVIIWGNNLNTLPMEKQYICPKCDGPTESGQ